MKEDSWKLMNDIFHDDEESKLSETESYILNITQKHRDLKIKENINNKI